MNLDQLNAGISEARGKGASDEDILSHLASQNPGFAEAKNRGASLGDVLSHLGTPKPSMGQEALDYAKEAPSRALQGALGAVPGAASYETSKNPNADTLDKVAAASGDIGGGLLAAGTGGLSIPSGMAMGAALEGSGINPLARKAEAAIENVDTNNPSYQGSVASNFIAMAPRYALGGIVGIIPSLAASLGMAKGLSKLPQSFNKPVPSGQELPALGNIVKKGIGPETGFTKSGESMPTPKDSGLLSVLDTVKKTRSQLGNNMGQMTALADSKLGPMNPKSFQPQIGNAVSNALQESGVSTPQAKAAVQKWFQNDLPNINTLSDLHDSIKNFNNSIKGHLGMEGNMSSMPLSAMKNALSDVLESHIPPELGDSFGKAKNAFAQYATLEDGLKASTPGLQAKLRGKTPSVQPGTDLSLSPAKFSKWWNETLSPSEKARFDPEFRKAIDNLTTQPKLGPVGMLRKGAGLTNEVIKNLSLGVSKGVPVLEKLNQPPEPSFSRPVPSFIGRQSTKVNNLMDALPLRRK